MKDNVDFLPIWKEGATAYDRFSELAMIARNHPERFAKIFVIYVEEKDGFTKLNSISNNLGTHECLGLLFEAQYRMLKRDEE